MRSPRRNFGVGFGMLALVLPSGQSAVDNMQCVVELEVPRYSWIARGAAQDTGTVSVDFLVGRHGTIADMHGNGPDPRLIEEAESFLKAGAKLLPSCEGRRVQLLFTFQMDGEARDYPFTRVKFRPPNHFIIVSQRTRPTIDKIPVQPKDSKPDESKK